MILQRELAFRLDNLDPIEVMDKIGVTYDHGKLPPECDGLF